MLDKYVGEVGHIRYIGQLCGRGWTYWTNMWERLDILDRDMREV